MGRMGVNFGKGDRDFKKFIFAGGDDWVFCFEGLGGHGKGKLIKKEIFHFQRRFKRGGKAKSGLK